MFQEFIFPFIAIIASLLLLVPIFYLLYNKRWSAAFSLFAVIMAWGGACFLFLMFVLFVFLEMVATLNIQSGYGLEVVFFIFSFFALGVYVSVFRKALASMKADKIKAKEVERTKSNQPANS